LDAIWTSIGVVLMLEEEVDREVPQIASLELRLQERKEES
jgi:hypothetical protein